MNKYILSFFRILSFSLKFTPYLVYVMISALVFYVFEQLNNGQIKLLYCIIIFIKKIIYIFSIRTILSCFVFYICSKCFLYRDIGNDICGYTKYSR